MILLNLKLSKILLVTKKRGQESADC